MPAELKTTILQQQTIATDVGTWLKSLSFNQFDPTLGNLLNIRVSIADTVVGSLGIENLGPTKATVSASITGGVSVSGPAGMVLGSAYAGAGMSLQLSGFDGTMDFAGRSGAAASGINGTNTADYTIAATNPAAAGFVGQGLVNLTANGGASGLRVDGAGSLRLDSSANVGAVVGLQYQYEVPEPVGTGTGGTYSGTFTYQVGPGYFQVWFESLTPPLLATTPALTTNFETRLAGWSDTFSIGRFDPSLGTLYEMEVTLSANILGSVAAENRGAGLGSVTANEAATVAIQMPGTLSAISAVTSVTDSFSLGGFDQSNDFSGTSGRVDSGLINAGTVTAVLSAASTDLSAFIGTGSVAVPIGSTGTASANGPADLSLELLTKAGATASVRYRYVPSGSIPQSGTTEPSGVVTTFSPSGGYVFTPITHGSGAQVALACFATGTRITTPDGAVPVESLSIRQTVTTLLRGEAPIRWIGMRDVDCEAHPQPEKVWPVHIEAGAFGPGLPARDLRLSPDHAVFVEGVLMPIRVLINGGSIRQIPVDRVTYHHIELAEHDVLLAESLPAESFLDTGNRAAFLNGGRVVQMHPDFSALTWDARGCAPLEVTGPRVSAARDRLAQRMLVAA